MLTMQVGWLVMKKEDQESGPTTEEISLNQRAINDGLQFAARSWKTGLTGGSDPGAGDGSL